MRRMEMTLIWLLGPIARRLRSGPCLRCLVLLPVFCVALPALAQGSEQKYQARNIREWVDKMGRIGEATQQVVVKDDFYAATHTTPVVPQKKNTECEGLSRDMHDALIGAGADSALQAAFAKHCMRDWTAALVASSPQPLEHSLALVLGVLVDEDGRAFCSAFRIASDRIATARHCFFARDTGAVVNDIGRTGFQLAGINQTYRIEAVEQMSAMPTGPYSTSNDAISLVVAELKSTEMPALVLSDDPRVGEALLLIGASPEFSAKRQFLSDADPKGCQVGVKDAICFYHGCNAGEGYSGAPVVRPALNAQGALQVIGMHVEGTGTAGSDCRFPKLDGAGNTALFISKKF